MFEDLSLEEKNVLDLLAKAEIDKDFKELELYDFLKQYDDIDSIRLSLFDKGYINLKVENRNPKNIQTAYKYINGHLLTDYALDCYKRLNNRNEL